MVTVVRGVKDESTRPGPVFVMLTEKACSPSKFPSSVIVTVMHFDESKSPDENTICVSEGVKSTPSSVEVDV